ncbi:MAG: glycosyl hydrolase family 28-related protein, partial [Verrucomicrobiota bacterium]
MMRDKTNIRMTGASGDSGRRERHKTVFLALLLSLCTVVMAGAAPNSDTLSVRDFGAQGDGKTDDTAAFQKALDTAGQVGGGVVYAPRGNY